ncbi:response regulator transcription factor [Plantibacter sp. Mn2098]|uniref:response regulator transcription factor n=1 Tax=Plantibacter sp. Mn2098 TaxID=3395266 RepID=UPI003BD29FC9
MRVLIVDDEVYLAEAIRDGLDRVAIAADVAHDGDDALDLISVNDYDAVILDRDIPGTHGDDVCRLIAASGAATRVLMLTAAGRLEQKVSGFGLGADDYLAKPFEFDELIARLHALARRTSAPLPPVLEMHGITLDPFRHEVRRNGEPVRLARKEFAVLEVLLRAGGGVVSAEILLEKAWDRNVNPFSNTTRVTVSTLRKRLGEPWVIETVPGVGYRIAPETMSEEGDLR